LAGDGRSNGHGDKITIGTAEYPFGILPAGEAGLYEFLAIKNVMIDFSSESRDPFSAPP
jgi:hypothetical protein